MIWMLEKLKVVGLFVSFFLMWRYFLGGQWSVLQQRWTTLTTRDIETNLPTSSITPCHLDLHTILTTIFYKCFVMKSVMNESQNDEQLSDMYEICVLKFRPVTKGQSGDIAYLHICIYFTHTFKPFFSLVLLPCHICFISRMLSTNSPG